MGGAYSLYGRKKDTEKYIHLQDLNDKYMKIFKHNVVAYSQDKKHNDMKSLYLYKGYLRIGKAYLRSNYLELTFQTAAFANEWDTCEEQVDDVPWLFRNFTKSFKPVNTDYSYMRVYQRN
tara:strand:- start:1451 stop:1810 length:360 start_codon:yes stop_codon:yes gene_type:complete